MTLWNEINWVCCPFNGSQGLIKRFIIIQGLEFIAESNESSVPPKSVTDTEGKVLSDNSAKGPVASKMRIHRSYPVGLSLTRNVLGPGF